MIFLKKLLKFLGIYSIILIFIVILTSFLNLLGVNSTITNLILFIFNITMFLIFGFKAGKLATSKGYFAGLKLGLLFLLLLFIINLITSSKLFTLSMLIYYSILLLSCIFGGMLGINKKSKD